jgi:acetyltransferase-like isoleucine patch superfamily enzyme
MFKKMFWIPANIINRARLAKYGVNGDFTTYGIINFKLAKSCSIKIGSGTTIRSHWKSNPAGGGQQRSIIALKDGASIEIGNNVGISNSTIYCSESIVIQDDVLVGVNCVIYDTDCHALDYNQRLAGDKGVKQAPVIIKQGAWIGGHCIVLKGVTIGKHSVIGAGSVVTKDVPDYELWAGNPARFIKRIER